ncbi:MAG: hypothetical protein H0W75_12295 [Chitinophagaceae bacterium]|nr:hypothetical protein [Chitinophagaceae bacterium]
MNKLKLIVLILSAITLLNFWQSCKKGPEDPFFSLHSRLARVTGDWNITDYRVNGKDSLRVVPPADSLTFIGACGTETDKKVINYNFIWSFDKTGFFQEKLNVDTSIIFDIANNTPICKDSTHVDSSIIITIKEWNFTNGVGTLKNKEQLYLLDNETKEVLLYDIIELRNNEMKLLRDTIDPISNQAKQKTYTLTRIK